MQFTPLEMASLYRQAKSKAAQITAFQELNSQTEAEVIASLLEGGIDQKDIPKKRKAKKKCPCQLPG